MLEMTFQFCYCCDWEVLAGAWGLTVLRCTGDNGSLQGAQVQPHLCWASKNFFPLVANGALVFSCCLVLDL